VANTLNVLTCATGVLNMKHLHELRYQSLFNAGRALSFPCDAEGHVHMDLLSSNALANYLYARVVVGREYASPLVREVLRD